MEDACRFCGKKTRRVKSHEWQCAKNPAAKTAHYEKFRSSKEEDARRTDQPPSAADAGVRTVKFDPPARAPPKPAAADPHTCGACKKDVGGPVAKCPHCGVGLTW